ncbi:MAG: type II toxin-antitoxin system PemK/MazF family toxin [Candidatus Lactobacillus pullistercoris]|uniref:Type II toxin-antitoxin system PemK/MazF family toxin n=1 Tax=Candidatus Lactobacillus pullistercoris TaxID=2838636 RepID=A0A9E2NU71_9LACO|nr:type II toxin-antitoxin system PemK/MazF family toxin [Candidatus Lactobacillus pullistercoris]
MTKNIATAYVRFIQIKSGKRRPVYILREDDKEIYFFDITSKYKNKSDFIKQWYFEIFDYQTIGLRKHSWIDTYKVYALNKNSTEIKFIGKLSDKDISRLKTFIKKIRMNK